jgi:hypothetical protein
MPRVSLALVLFFVFSLFFIGQASAGQYEINGTTYPMIYNGTYVSQNINYMVQYGTGYDIFWNGGLLQTVWDGTYAYDKIAYPNNGTAISPWTFWHVESYRTSGQGTWQEEIPISNTFVKIDNNTLRREMVLGSGGKFNITYNNLGTRIKQDLELTAGQNRKYRLVYRIDSVAAQTVVPTQKRFTPDFFKNFTIYDVTDVLPYTVNETNGSYLYGWNTSASIDNTNRKMYFTLENNQVMAIGQRVDIDPSWSTNGSTSPQFINSTLVNLTINQGTNNLELRQQVDDYISYWRADGTAKDDNRTSANEGTFVGNANASAVGLYNNAFGLDGVGDYVSLNSNIGNTTGNISIFVRVKLNTLTGTQVIFSRTSELSPWPQTWTLIKRGSDNRICFQSSQDSYLAVCSLNAVTTGTWYNITGTYEGSGNKKRKIYIEKELQNEGTYSGDPPTNIGASMAVIGASSTDNPLYFVNGTIDDIRFYYRIVSNDEINLTINQSKYSSGYIKTWYNSTPNENYQIDVNGTWQANSNTSLQYAQNGSSPSSFESPANVTSNQSWALGTKYINTDTYIWFFGNGTLTPSLSQITFFDQIVSGGDTTPPTYSYASHNQTIAGQPTLFSVYYNDETALHPAGQWIFSTNNTGSWINDSAVNWTATPQWANVTKTLNSTAGTVVGYRWYAFDNAGNWNSTETYTLTVQDITSPASITELTNATDNFYHNWTWTNPTDNDFNYTMIYLNGIFVLNQSVDFYNLIADAHNVTTISTHTVDISGNINQTWVNHTSAIPNNIPIQSSIDNKNVDEGQWLNFTISSTDIDGDSLTYGTNASKGTFNTTTGNFNWSTVSEDVGTYYWNFNSSDNYSGVDDETITVTVQSTAVAENIVYSYVNTFRSYIRR